MGLGVSSDFHSFHVHFVGKNCLHGSTPFFFLIFFQHAFNSLIHINHAMQIYIYKKIGVVTRVM